MNPKQHADAVKAAKRGNLAQRVKVLVEGEYFSYDVIAERTGRKREEARHRYAHLKRSGKWPITWEMLAIQPERKD